MKRVHLHVPVRLWKAMLAKAGKLQAETGQNVSASEIGRRALEAYLGPDLAQLPDDGGKPDA